MIIDVVMEYMTGPLFGNLFDFTAFCGSIVWNDGHAYTIKKALSTVCIASHHRYCCVWRRLIFASCDHVRKTYSFHVHVDSNEQSSSLMSRLLVRTTEGCVHQRPPTAIQQLGRLIKLNITIKLRCSKCTWNVNCPSFWNIKHFL